MPDDERLPFLELLLTGLAAGDSLGSTSEFNSRARMPQVYAQYSPEGWPFRQVGGGACKWNAGEPTDDTDMAMCLVKSYRQLGRFDGEDVGRRFVDWMKTGPRDIGSTTSTVLSAIRNGTSWREAGRQHWLKYPDSLANGSLMRNGVVAGLAETLDEAWRMTLQHGMITHYAPLCQLCCAAQTWMIWRLLNASPPPLDWVAPFREEFMHWLNSAEDLNITSWHADVESKLEHAGGTLAAAEWDPDRFNPYTGDLHHQGYVLLTLQIAWWALQWSLRDEPFPSASHLPAEVFSRTGPWVLSWVAMIGADSDTYGATAGPLIAAAHKGLPSELTDNLWVLRDL